MGTLASLGHDTTEISCNITVWALSCDMVKSHHGSGWPGSNQAESIGQVDASWCPPIQSKPDIPINPQLLPRGLGWQLWSPAKFANAFLSSVIFFPYLVLLCLLLLVSIVCFFLKDQSWWTQPGWAGRALGLHEQSDSLSHVYLGREVAWTFLLWVPQFPVLLMLPSPAHTAVTEPLKTIDWGNRSRIVYFFLTPSQGK